MHIQYLSVESTLDLGYTAKRAERCRSNELEIPSLGCCCSTCTEETDNYRHDSCESQS